MNKEEVLRRLAASARSDTPPPVDVTHSVLRDIRQKRSDVRPVFLTVAAVSSAAAVLMAFFASQAWAAYQDPLSQLFEPIVRLIQ